MEIRWRRSTWVFKLHLGLNDLQLPVPKHTACVQSTMEIPLLNRGVNKPLHCISGRGTTRG